MKIDDRAKREKVFFDSLAKSNKEYWGCETPTGQLRLYIKGELISRAMHAKKGAKLLDLGCGFGALTQHLTDLKCEIYGVDISSQSVAIARKKIKSSKIFFKPGNAHDLDFKSGYFDMIVGNAILHHLELDKALSEIFRTLKKGGQIIFFEPNLINPQVLLERKIPYCRRLVRNSEDETAFIRWQLEKELKNAGFKNVKVTPYDFLYPALPLSFAKTFKKISDVLEKTPLIREISGSLKITASK